MPRIPSSVLGFFFAVVLLPGVVFGQAAQESSVGPVPAQIASSKKVFISNGGTETPFYIARRIPYSGGPNRIYNQFYAATKAWGQYELVSSPADADLIFAISAIDRLDKTLVMTEITLRIIDPKTHITLWSFMNPVEPANLAKNRERNLDMAMATLLSDVKALVRSQGTAAER